jgi:hypothetical protein
MPADRARKPREWGVELVKLGPSTIPDAVRVTLIDRETGRRIGSRTLQWEEFRDVAQGLVLTNIAEGVYE